MAEDRSVLVETSYDDLPEGEEFQHRTFREVSGFLLGLVVLVFIAFPLLLLAWFGILRGWNILAIFIIGGIGCVAFALGIVDALLGAAKADR